MGRSPVRKLGFTLIELMVVVSVIAILLGLGAASYTNAQKKARNSARKSDMRAMQTAFEQYYAINDRYAVNCAVMAPGNLPEGLPVERKPSPWEGYTTGSGSCALESYCTCAHLEGETGNSSNGACDFSGPGTKEWFCVVNQQ